MREPTCSHIRLVATKTMAWSSPASRNNSSNFSSFSMMSRQKATFCSMSVFTVNSVSPIRTSTGSLRNSEPKRRTAGGHVAVNMSVCLSTVSLEIIFLIWGSNPISSMRSASSKIKKRTLVRSTAQVRPGAGSSKSLSLPGVHTSNCGRCLNSANCGPFGAPPYRQHVRNPAGPPNLFASTSIWHASSLVGASTSMAGGPLESPVAIDLAKQGNK
mmetsp:Transcript_59668/g.158787  ORF Transcript_59668/g.158787 Transcript_59668/m.158787 type:complete len:215 (-) Transcript_59668:89-733(-)